MIQFKKTVNRWTIKRNKKVCCNNFQVSSWLDLTSFLLLTKSSWFQFLAAHLPTFQRLKFCQKKEKEKERKRRKTISWRWQTRDRWIIDSSLNSRKYTNCWFVFLNFLFENNYIELLFAITLPYIPGLVF